MTLRMEQVCAGYSGNTILRDVDITVPTGRVVALLGPNGAGKSTLLRVGSGLLRPSAGRTLLDGNNLTGRSSDHFAEQGITLIPEGRGVFPNLSVRENLLLFAPADDQDTLDLALDAFPRLGQRLTQIAGTMSGGEQQMLALSRAYVRQSSTVLLDEVSMGLAPLIVDEIYEALSRLAAAGRALLLVEQFAAKALAMADIVYVLAGGRISFAGEPAEVDDELLTASYFGESTTTGVMR